MLRNDLKINTIESLDCKIVRCCCETIARRAAYLAGSGNDGIPQNIVFYNLHFIAISALINRMNRPMVTVGVDGSLFRHHPSFPGNMHAIITKFKNPNCDVRYYIYYFY